MLAQYGQGFAHVGDRERSPTRTEAVGGLGPNGLGELVEGQRYRGERDLPISAVPPTIILISADDPFCP
jgi:hypothetical protein